jgi:hypothetical protein
MIYRRDLAVRGLSEKWQRSRGLEQENVASIVWLETIDINFIVIVCLKIGPFTYMLNPDTPARCHRRARNY